MKTPNLKKRASYGDKLLDQEVITIMALAAIAVCAIVFLGEDGKYIAGLIATGLIGIAKGKT